MTHRAPSFGHTTAHRVGGLLFVAALLLAGSDPAHALDRGRNLSEHLLESWSTDDGLPQSTVRAIQQTRDGYLWVGTAEGLARFDGVRFEVYDERSVDAFANSYVTALVEDEAGALWIGTREGGVVRLAEGEFTGFTTEQGLPSDRVLGMTAVPGGGVWIATSGGVARSRGDAFEAVPVDLEGERPSCLTSDGAGRVWVGSKGGGLASCQGGRCSRSHAPGDLTGGDIMAIHAGTDGVTWLGTERGGLLRMDGDTVTSVGVAEGLNTLSVFSLAEDRQGTLWVGTMEGGICRIVDDRTSCLTPEDGAPFDTVMALEEDLEGSLWIGTHASGLARMRDTTFHGITAQQGLSDGAAFAILDGREGTWIGSSRGLNRVRDGAVVPFAGQSEVAGVAFGALLEDASGDLWAGSASHGILRLRGGEWTFHRPFGSIGGVLVFAIAQDPRGSVWFGTRAGLARFADGEFDLPGSELGLPDTPVLSLLVGRDGALWLGTKGHGIYRRSGGPFEPVATGVDLEEAQRSVLCMLEDGDGALWVGTRGGLLRIREGETAVFTVREGLFDDLVYAILEDDEDHLWMSCNRGIFRVSKAQLEEVARGERPDVDALVFGTADGMPSRECSGGAHPAAARDREGRMWFPTGTAGVAVVDPGDIRTNPVPPPLVIERVLVDGVVVEHERGLELNPGAKRLEIHYTALSFVKPERTRFAHHLEGFEEGWVDAGSQRVVQYTNLPPGEYRFQVRACNADGVWNEEGTALSLVRRPHLYETRAFYGACGVAVLAVFGAIYGLRVRQLRQRRAELEEEVEARSRELIEAQDLLAEARHLPIRFGPYLLVSVLGEGGMARVYRAVREGPMGFRKEVALKRLRTDLTRGDDELVRSMGNEARLGGQLRHPNVVDVYEFGVVGEQAYLAMEFVPGWTLEDLLAGAQLRGVTLPHGAALDLMIQIADGLAHAHDLRDPDGQPLNLVHRDLKPSNVLISTAAQAKIADFGIARGGEMLGQTVTGTVKGTPRFMSPEQVEDPRNLDRRSDLFAFGAVLYEVVTGHRLLHASAFEALVWQLVSGKYRSRLSRVDQALSAARPILDRCLHRDRNQRYGDARELGDDLRRLREEIGDPLGCRDLIDLLRAWSEGDPRDFERLRRRLRKRRTAGSGWEAFLGRLDADLDGLPDPFARPLADPLDEAAPDAEAASDTRGSTVIWRA